MCIRDSHCPPQLERRRAAPVRHVVRPVRRATTHQRSRYMGAQDVPTGGRDRDGRRNPSAAADDCGRGRVGGHVRARRSAGPGRGSGLRLALHLYAVLANRGSLTLQTAQYCGFDQTLAKTTLGRYWGGEVPSWVIGGERRGSCLLYTSDAADDLTRV